MSRPLTVIELCISQEQTSPLSLTIHDPGERVAGLLADALYDCKSTWGEPEYAAATIIARLGEYSRDIALAVSSRRQPGADIFVVDFISKLVSDRTTRKSYKFSKWLERHDVP